jgi:hypothetical protein
MDHPSLPSMGYHLPLTEQCPISGKTTQEDIDNPFQEWNIPMLLARFLQEPFWTLEGVSKVSKVT